MQLSWKESNKGPVSKLCMSFSLSSEGWAGLTSTQGLPSNQNCPVLIRCSSDILFPAKHKTTASYLAAFFVRAALLLIRDSINVRILPTDIAVPCPPHEALEDSRSRKWVPWWPHASKIEGFTWEPAQNIANPGTQRSTGKILSARNSYAANSILNSSDTSSLLIPEIIQTHAAAKLLGSSKLLNSASPCSAMCNVPWLTNL